MSELDSESAAKDSEAGRTAIAWAAGTGQGDDLVHRIEASVARKRRRKLTRAVGGFAALVVIGLAFHSWPRVPDVPTLPASAIVSLPVQRTLPDGSVVELKDRAVIEEAFTVDIRRVRLRHGEAHFDVVKDKNRPFIVEAGGVEVRAVGTAFLVQVSASQVGILVTEGRVTVGGKLTLDAGSRVMVENVHAAAPPAVLAVSPAEELKLLSWRVPRLNFGGTPLAEAVPLFNEYSRGRRLVLAPGLEDLQISGVLRADNTDAFLRILKNEFGIVAENRGDDIYLRGR